MLVCIGIVFVFDSNTTNVARQIYVIVHMCISDGGGGGGGSGGGGGCVWVCFFFHFAQV